MTEANRVHLAGVRETTLGVTPNTPRMRKQRFTGETLAFKPVSTKSNTINDDRMSDDPILVGRDSNGPVTFEWHYPVPGSLVAEELASVFMNDWVDTPNRDNDGTADSVITDIGTTANTIVFTTGPAFAVGHLVRTTGFATAANNKLAKVTTGGATSLVASAAAYVAEAAPPAAARVKVVGFEGAAADITATATGLGSIALDFTTLGLAVGQWVKIGGAGTAFRFATEALNAWARITAIAAAALTLDNLPLGWATDAGTGKTIRVFFGDQVKNGVAKIGLTLERAFKGQSVPSYIVQKGMVADQFQLPIQKRQPINCTVTFKGLGASTGTVALDAAPDAAPRADLYPVAAGSANVGRVAENGVRLTSPNWADSVTYTIANNGRGINDVQEIDDVDYNSGECDVTVALTSYFGDLSLYAKLLAMTPTNVNSRIVVGSTACIWAVPRCTPTDGNPNASGKNSDVMLPLTLSASRDPLTNAHVLLDRLEFFEA